MSNSTAGIIPVVRSSPFEIALTMSDSDIKLWLHKPITATFTASCTNRATRLWNNMGNITLHTITSSVIISFHENTPANGDGCDFT